jgi:dTDP-glucose 4,6-dehydratase
MVQKKATESLDNATILVCGGAGFIGSNFIRLVLGRYANAHVVCFDALTYAGNKENLKDLPANRLLFIKGNIADPNAVDRVFKKYTPTYVVNFAAESHVDRSIHGGALDFIESNVRGTGVLLNALTQAPYVKKYLQVSTDEVYGSLPLASRKKFTESTALAPNSPYAASKAAADHLVRAFFTTYKVPVVITRCANNYGPYQYPEKLIPFSIYRVLKGEPITIYGDGKYVRDWIHVDDHNEAILQVLLKGIAGEIYNIGADDEIDNLTLAKQLLKHLDKDVSHIQFVTDRPGHDRRYASNSKKTRSLGWKPKHTLKSSLKSTVDWYREHEPWANRALKKGDANTHLR